MRRTHAVVALALALCTAQAAHADDPKAAERFFRAGEKAYKAQNFAAAAENFEAAYKELPLPEIAFSAAQAYRRQYRVEPKPAYVKRAVELYAVYLDKVKTGGRVGAAADSLGEMQRELDRIGAAKMVLPVAAEQTRLGINPEIENETAAVAGRMSEIGDLPDASAVKITTLLDGKVVPPFELMEVAPGNHAIHVEAEGFLPADETGRAFQGTSKFVDIKLVPRPARVHVITERGARVRVDGRPVGGAPGVFEVPAGKHLISISRDGREPIAREVVVTRGQELTLRESLAKTVRRRAVPWVVGVAGGFTLLTLTTALGASVEDGRAADALDRFQTQGDATEADLRAYERHVTNRDRLVTGTWVLGGAAVISGAAAFVLYWFDSPSDEHVRVVPMLSQGTGGAAVFGRF